MRQALISLCCIALLGQPLHAAPKKPNQTQQEEAQQLFEQASTDYKLQKYQEALVGFEGAYRLSNEPALLFNIGQCYRQLGQFEDAQKAFQAFLRDAPKNPLRPNAEARLAEIEQELIKLSKKGTLRISTEQDPAEVFLDGVTKGKSPLTLENLDSGDHSLIIKKGGFAEYTSQITIKPTETTELTALRLVPVTIPEVKRAKSLRLSAIGLGAFGTVATVTSLTLAIQAGNQLEININDPSAGNIEDEVNTRDTQLGKKLIFAQVSGVGAGVLLGSAVASVLLSVIVQKKADKLQKLQEK